MNYKISINELNYNDGTLSAVTPLYEQTVENLDIRAVIDAVNNAPATAIKQRRAPRSDKGKKRNLLGEVIPVQA